MFDPDAYLAEPSGFDPDAYLATPTPTPTPTAVAEAGEEDGFLAKINAALRKPSPEWLQAPEQAARELVTGMIPRTPREYLAQIYPPAAAGELGASLAQGDVSGLPFAGRIPEIIEAEETPAGSKERYLTAMKTLMDVGMLAGAGAKPRAPTLAERITQPRVEPPAPLVAEKITASAFKLPNGEIVDTGPYHSQGQVPAGSEAGFLTTKGRFVGREEAGQLATGLKQPLFAEDFVTNKDIVPSLLEHPIAEGIEAGVPFTELPYTPKPPSAPAAAPAVEPGRVNVLELAEKPAEHIAAVPAPTIHPRFRVVGSRGRGEATATSDYDLVTKLNPEENAAWINTPEGEYPTLPQEIKDAANAGHDVFIETEGGRAWKVEPHPVSTDPAHVVVERVSQIEQNLLAGIRSQEELIQAGKQKLSGAGPPPTPPVEPPVPPEDVAYAGGEPPAPAPKTRKFSLQLQADTDLIQNLKDKIGNRTYEPIPNKITADQAVKLVDERPIPDVINAIQDEANGVPGHVRSAMGQIVIKRLNKAAESLGQAGKTMDADIALNQAVNLAEWMQEFGTRSGQTVQSFAMWQALSPEGKLTSVTRKVRKARANHEHENPGEVKEIVDGAKQSGDEAKGKASRAQEDKVDQLVKREQDKIARQLSDTPTWKMAAKNKQNEILALIRAHLRESQDAFVARMLEFGVDRRLSESIDRMALENRRRIDVIREARTRERRTAQFDSIADSIAQQLSDTPTFRAQGQADPARALIRAHLKESQPDFVNRIIKYGADRKTAETIDRLAVENRERILKIDRAKRAEELRKMFTRQNRTARKLTKKNWERIVELADHGLLTDQTFYDIASDRLGLPKYDAATAREIMRLAQEIDRLPEGMPRDQAVFNLNRFIATKMGFRLSDLPMGVYYGNMLSGYNTHIVNALDTFLNVGSEINGMALSNPRSALKIYGNTLRGFGEGSADALMALTRGRMLTNSRWMELPRLMEVAKFGEKGGVPPLGTGLAGRIVTRLAESRAGYPLNAWKYVGRLMSASDAIMFRGAKEGRAALLADRLARDEGLRGKALNRRVQEELGRTTEQETLFRQQAKDEGFSGPSEQARVNELRERGRSMEANADADDFAGLATYNHKPQGVLGYMASKVGEASEKYPALRTVVPFTQIVANVTNRGLNYTPWGFKRALRGYSGEVPPKGDARRAMLARSTMGSTGLGLLYTLQQQGAVEIHGAGPSDPDKRKQLQEAGWRPYSMKVGDHYLSYLPTPLGLGLSILGNMSDVQRYGEMDQKSALLRGTYALSRVGSTIFSQSFLSSLSTLFEALSGQSPGQQLSAWRRLFSGISGTATTPKIVLDVQRIFDPQRYESNTIAGDLLKNTPFSAMVNRPILNAFGEPIEPPTNRFISAASDDLAWRAIAEANLRVPVPDKYTTMPDGRGGKRQITPEEYYEYLEKSGPLVKQYIVRDTFNLTHMPPDKAQDLLSKKSQEIRQRVLNEIRRRAQFTPAD